MADPTHPILCGVDVSQATLDIAQAGQAPACIPNTVEAIAKWLASMPVQACIAVEATGHYHECLQQQAIAAGHKVYLINGNQLRHYREAVGQRAKTDAEDARLLLRYLTHELGELEPAKSLKSDEKRIWSLLRRRATLVKVRSQLKLSLRGEPELCEVADEVVTSLNQAIARTDQLMQQLAKALDWETAIERCRGIPGIGQVNAIALVTCFNRGDFRRSDQWIAYLGLDVRVRDSGKSKGRRRLSKRGNPELRRLLYTGAMSVAHTSAMRSRYDQYLARGLSPTAAIVALSRKLARIAFAVLSKNEAYDEKVAGLACVTP